ncbi:unnamed protein product [Blepharisma stoltei]|uniref:Uncharacterized protein n=1 Tax=Blepharisma stoltei TaxID=1481888 RepID=A0AAU9JBG1_9CILI|nr:unnamed protein product [Blepharisma stoltei]
MIDKNLSKTYRTSLENDFLKSSSRSSTPSIYRHTDLGYEMHTVARSRKETDNKVQLLDNRIKMLLRKDNSVQKAAENAHKKADYLLKTRERYINDVMAAHKLKVKKEKEIEKMKEIAQIRKKVQESMLKEIKEEVVIDKKYSAKEIKKISSLNEVKAKENKHLDLRKKLGSKFIKQIEDDMIKRKRSVSQLNYKNAIREKYENKIQIEKELREDSVKKLTELEELEAALLLKLSDTMTLRNQALSKLESISKISPPYTPSPVMN